jgi:hypothetical protein
VDTPSSGEISELGPQAKSIPSSSGGAIAHIGQWVSLKFPSLDHGTRLRRFL